MFPASVQGYESPSQDCLVLASVQLEPGGSECGVGRRPDRLRGKKTFDLVLEIDSSSAAIDSVDSQCRPVLCLSSPSRTSRSSITGEPSGGQKVRQEKDFWFGMLEPSISSCSVRKRDTHVLTKLFTTLSLALSEMRVRSHRIWSSSAEAFFLVLAPVDLY